MVRGSYQSGTWNDSQARPTARVDQLIKDAHAALEAAGVVVSPSKVSRRIRNRVDRSGIDSASGMIRDYIGHTRERGSFDAFCLTYADPTGETAVANLMRRPRSGSTTGGE